MNETLERQRAGVLCEPHAGPSEGPIGVLKREVARNLLAEEIHLRAVLNGRLYADCVPSAWLDRFPSAMVPVVRRLARADMACVGIRAERRVSNFARDRASGDAAAVRMSRPAAPAAAADDNGTDGSGNEADVEGYAASPPPSPAARSGGAAAAAAGGGERQRAAAGATRRRR